MAHDPWVLAAGVILLLISDSVHPRIFIAAMPYDVLRHESKKLLISDTALPFWWTLQKSYHQLNCYLAGGRIVKLFCTSVKTL